MAFMAAIFAVFTHLSFGAGSSALSASAALMP
jgi:hypothetical protein